jgi:hypothetical protein
MGSIAAGMLGNAVGGILGSAAESAGEEVSKAVEQHGERGDVPLNRIMLLVKRPNRTCRVYFDVNGADRREMNHEANLLFRDLQKARCAFTAAEPQESAEVGFLKESDTLPEAIPRRGTRPEFRVLRAGKIVGVYSLDRLSQLLSSGQLKVTDLIGVEAWIPVSNLGVFLLGGSSPPLPVEGGSAGKGEGETAQVKPRVDDNAPLAVGDEFKM